MTWVKRIGIAAAGLVVVIVLGAATVFGVSESKLKARYTVKPEAALTVSADSASVAHGEHVARSLAMCVDCHMPDFGGQKMIDDPAFAYVEAPNLTTGKGGVLSGYDDAALERAIRHGVGSDGRSLMIMPSASYNSVSDDDLAALIAYLRARPAVDREHQPVRVGPVLRALWVTGKFVPTPAAIIAHDAPHLQVAPQGNSVERGKYLANSCAGCHGAGFSGGPMADGPPDAKPAANLTPTGIGSYSLADFTTILREGKRPNGTVVDAFMPVPATKLMTDDEIESLYKFLKTVPPRPYGNH